MRSGYGPNPKPMKSGEADKRGKELRGEVYKSVKRSVNKDSLPKVIKGLDGTSFGNFLRFAQMSPQQQAQGDMVSLLQELARSTGNPDLIAKSISLSTPLASGFVPFDLRAPTRLLYYTEAPFRAKIPRIPAQGTAYRIKAVTGISGSHTGGQSVLRASMGELNGGSFSQWPIALPASGGQSAEDVILNQRFFGLSEYASFLAQFAGQGYEDIAALTSLILLQEALLTEEHAIISGIYNNIPTPGAPTLTARAAVGNETAITGATSNIYVKVVGKNYYGQTAASSGGSTAFTSGVVDVNIAPANGALQYDLYVTTGTVAGTYYLVASNVGGHRYTIQGALPTGGTQPPTSDSGTGSHNDYDGLVAVLTGNTQSGTYPADGSFTGGYINQSLGSSLTVAAIYDVLAGLYDNSSSTNTSANGGYRARPQEIVGEAYDLMNLSLNVLSQNSGGQQGYNLFITQDEVDNVRAGTAISQFVNQFTRDVVRLVPHPWLTQGTTFVMSYQIPPNYSNVGNALEMGVVQDYVTVQWPVDFGGPLQ